jgi:hypothetical protein
MTSSPHVPARPWLLFAVLLGAGLGCFSLEPLSSYSKEGPSPQEPPAAEEPAPPGPEPGVTPGDSEPETPVDEGAPGAGDIALEPSMLPGAAQPDAGQPASMPTDPLASEPPATPSCAGPGEFSSADGQTCYRASTENATWTDAFAGCQMWGGGLVIIESREEDELIGQHLVSSSWIGASDLVQEGRMLWIGGAPVVFGNWGMGQPDDFQGREDCVVKTVPAGSWNDLPCRNLNAYVCERPEN